MERIYTCVCVCVCVMLVTQSCPTLYDPTDCSLLGSSFHRILQARILEWVAIPFSRYLPNQGIKPRSPTLQADSLPSELRGKPYIYIMEHYSTIWWLNGKESACQCRNHRRCRLDPWVRESPWGRKWQPTAVALQGESHGQRSLVGCSP